MIYFKFNERNRLKSVVLRGKGAEENKNDPVVLGKLNRLRNPTIKHDCENFFKSDESCLLIL